MKKTLHILSIITIIGFQNSFGGSVDSSADKSDTPTIAELKPILTPTPTPTSPPPSMTSYRKDVDCDCCWSKCLIEQAGIASCCKKTLCVGTCDYGGWCDSSGNVNDTATSILLLGCLAYCNGYGCP